MYRYKGAFLSIRERERIGFVQVPGDDCVSAATV